MSWCRQWSITLVIVLLTVSGVVGASEGDPPTPTSTPTETERDTGTADDAGASAGQESSEAGEGSVPEPTSVALTEEEIPIARRSFKQKWHTFVQATRGLLVWDFFDGRLTVRSHARIMVDGTTAWGNNKFESFFGEPDSSVKIRRLSLFAQGTIDHRMRYSVSYDFGPDGGFGEAFIEGREHGLNVFGYRIGQFRLGFFQEPFSFERVESSYYASFLERALPVWTFTPGSNLGYMVYDTAFKDRMQWSVGFFSFGQGNEANSSDSTLSLTSRVSGLPVYRDDGQRLLHFGVSLSTRNPKAGTVRYKSRPEARFVDYLVDTDDIDAGRIVLIGAEAVALAGPIHIQAEVIQSRLDGTDWGTLGFWGYYVEAGWFITGEHRSYDPTLGTFSRMIPNTTYQGGVGGLFRKKKGGALEVVGRISSIDLNDGEFRGGKLKDFSAGLNWYLSPTSIVKLNYINSSVQDRGRVNILLLRYQYRPLPIPGWR